MSPRLARSVIGLSLLGSAACVDHGAAVATGTQSLKVDLITPANPGTPDAPLPDTVSTLTFNVTALDALGNLDPTFDRDVQVYAQFLGTLTPPLGSRPPLATFHVTAGKAMNESVTLPKVFGPTTLWIDDGDDTDPTYATGTSPTLFFRDPFIFDIQTPPDEMAATALSVSPLENKTIAVSGSRYGATGRLVITSIFSQGYTVSDVNCADAAGTPPCVPKPYDHLEVFTFSAPMDQNLVPMVEGETIAGFAGGITEFDGLTEIGFPQSFVAGAPDVNVAREPKPAVIDKATWFNPLSDPNGEINFERNEGGPVELDGGVVCMLDSDFMTFKQWKIDPNGVAGTPADCSNNNNVINVVTAGVISTLDPSTLQGKLLPKIVGILRPLNIGSFNLWIIYPRSMSDLTLQ